MRLDRLVGSLPGVSRAKAKEILRSGAVTIDGVVVKWGDREVDPQAQVVKVSGRTLNEVAAAAPPEVPPAPPHEEEVEDEPSDEVQPGVVPVMDVLTFWPHDISVLFENDKVLVVDKPVGLATIAERNGTPGVVDVLSARRGARIWTVHRLDREVGGVLVLAKEAGAHRALSKAFEERRVEKVYEAVTEGHFPERSHFRWTAPLARGKRRAFTAPHGKPAITEADFVGTEADGWHRWSIRLFTGRNHQIRVHLSEAGFPVAGDRLYGAVRKWPFTGIGLRAVKVVVPDPDGGPDIAVVGPAVPAPTGGFSGGAA